MFLPRLPFQPQTALTEPGYQQLFESFVGAFGQMVVWFPTWVYRLAAVGAGARSRCSPCACCTPTRASCAGAAASCSATSRWPAALMLLIGLSADLRRNLIAIVQGRYLLPLLPLFGALLALGARGAGERWGRAVGVAIVSGARRLEPVRPAADDRLVLRLSEIAG